MPTIDLRPTWTWLLWPALALPLAALWSFCAADEPLLSLPLLLFYFTLLLNTYFSIRFFGLTPRRGLSNYIIDICLTGIYVGMALSVGRPTLFCYLSVCLFLLGTAKYVLLIGSFANTVVLRRKIIIDLLGAKLCFVAFGAVWIGYSFIAVWMLATIFCLANIYLLQLKPMYRVSRW